ncbi:MAG: hypothetical protein H0U60_18555 [Blastocatellia bacterium]|nr:hypothetical protein [Blastocatellia bacterium]
MTDQGKWAILSRRVIQQVRDANPNATDKEMIMLLRAANPFGQRRDHPYKVWLKEVRDAVKQKVTQ